MDRLIKETHVVVVWVACDSGHVERVVDAVRQRTDTAPEVQHIELLTPGSGLECVVCADAAWEGEGTLGRILGALQPGGCLLLWECGGAREAAARSALTLHGFVHLEAFASHLFANKPHFEVGAKRTLRGGAVGGAWGGEGEAELVEEEQLLEEADLLRPGVQQLRVCASTGQRRACADCSCGLAAQLQGEQPSKQQEQPTSSCGSCYLGDAFRCSSCPYRGLPAFRPGERVLLQDLAPDL